MARTTVKVLEGRFKALSGLFQRAQLALQAGLGFAGARDYYTVFGYKRRLTFSDFFNKYARQDIAARIIDAPTQAVWNNPPKLEGAGNFSEVWDKLADEVEIWNRLGVADKLSGLGEFSILFLGFDDTFNVAGLSNPVTPSPNRKLLYLQPYSQASIKGIKIEDNPGDIRFGMPSVYRIAIQDPTSALFSVSGSLGGSFRNQTIKVHHSRIIHVAENTLETDLIGIPRLEQVYNLLDDLMKVVGGSAEMFWLSGRQGLHLDVDKDTEMKPGDAAALGKEAEEYQHQLRRILRTRGVKANVLQGSTANPQGCFDVILSLISGTTGIPQRILLGAEIGQLASEQDRANWADRITERRRSFAEPQILKPLVRMLQAAGVLAEGAFEIIWPNAFSMSPLDDAKMMAQQARAITNLSSQAKNSNPITSIEEAREIIGLPRDMPEGDTKFTKPRQTNRVRNPSIPSNGLDPNATTKPNPPAATT